VQGSGELVRLVVGESSQVLAFRDVVETVDDRGITHFPFDAEALDFSGSPARLWVGSDAGRVQSWLEGTAPQAADVTATLPYPVRAAVAYRQPDAGAAALFFGKDALGLVATAVREDGSLAAVVSLLCELDAPQTATVDLSSAPWVAGISPRCALADGGVAVNRYVAAAWTSSPSSTAPLVLSEEPAPTRLRMSGRENAITVAYEAEGAIRVSWLGASGELAAGRSVALGARNVLEDVGAFGDESAFVYALTNRAAAALQVTPTEAGGTPLQLAAGATLLVFGRWENGLTPIVTQTQVLAPARPFAALRFALDRASAAMWLAAVCPAGNVIGADCPTTGAQVTLFRWTPPPQP
jgi:hypothetical protein